jgi:adenylate cyclase
MAREIERKFLVKENAWPKSGGGLHYRQGYLSTVKERTVRVRTVNSKASLR